MCLHVCVCFEVFFGYVNENENHSIAFMTNRILLHLKSVFEAQNVSKTVKYQIFTSPTTSHHLNRMQDFYI